MTVAQAFIALSFLAFLAALMMHCMWVREDRP